MSVGNNEHQRIDDVYIDMIYLYMIKYILISL